MNARRELHLLTAALAREADPPSALAAYPGKLAGGAPVAPKALSAYPGKLPEEAGFVTTCRPNTKVHFISRNEPHRARCGWAYTLCIKHRVIKNPLDEPSAGPVCAKCAAAESSGSDSSA